MKVVVVKRAIVLNLNSDNPVKISPTMVVTDSVHLIPSDLDNEESWAVSVMERVIKNFVEKFPEFSHAQFSFDIKEVEQ